MQVSVRSDRTDEAAALFRLLGDPTRIQILETLGTTIGPAM